MTRPTSPPISSRTLVGRLRELAQNRPDDEAYVFLQDGETAGESLTWGALDHRVRALSAHLREQAERGDRALLLFPPGLDFIVAFCACLDAGVVAVPTSPPRLRRPQGRLRGIAQSARPSLVLSDRVLASRAAAVRAELPELDAAAWLTEIDSAEIDSSDFDASDARSEEPAGDDLAFLQFTSGSTSQPKGVKIRHSHLVANEEAIRRAFEQDQDSVVVGWLPFFHDMGLIGNILQPLWVGAKCVLMAPLTFLQKPERWLRAISTYRATTSGGPSFAYDLCARKITPEQCEGLDLSSWNVAYNGSEVVRSETLDRFAEAFSSYGFQRRAFFPCYGLAEATLFVTGGPKDAEPVVATVDRKALEEHRFEEISADDDAAFALVGSGRVAHEGDVRIVDPESGQEVEDGRIGEIRVAAPSVADGYWEMSDESGSAFAPHDEGVFLRTGDLGALRDGELFVTGRLKNLIILRGRNLYPHDLELAAERSHPSLRAGCGAAFAVEIEGEERLVIVHEIERRAKAAPEEIARAIRRAVQEEFDAAVYDVVLIRTHTLLKTSSGKIRHNACRDSYLADELQVVGRVGETSEAMTFASLDRATIAALPEGDRPAALLEDLRGRVAAALRLPREEVRAESSLSELGVDSLKAVELRAGVEADFGIDVPLADLLRGPRLDELAPQMQKVLQKALDGASETAAPIRAESEDGRFPLSYGQKAMFFLQRLAPDSAAYNLVGSGRIEGDLDVDALDRALASVVARHDALRTRFLMVDDEARQEIFDEREIPLVREDARSWDEDNVENYLVEQAYRPFDLENEALLRVHLLQTADDEHLLLLVIHHIVSDFWSLAVLLRDLGVFYGREGADQDARESAAALPPLPQRYVDFVAQENERISGRPGRKLEGWWRRHLGGELPVLQLPTDRPRPAVQTFTGASTLFRLGPEQAQRLRALGREQGTTLFVRLFSAFSVLIERWSDQQELILGTPTAGRDQADWAGIVGYFLNSLPLRVLPREAKNFDELARTVQTTALDAFAHQAYPFTLLVERLQPERDASRSAIFQTMFALHTSNLDVGRDLSGFALGEAGSTMDLGALTLESIAWTRRISQLDLTLIMAEVDDDVSGCLLYNTDLFDAVTMTRLGRTFQALVAAILDDPQQDLDALALLDPVSTHQLTVEWSTPLALPPARTETAEPLHELFAKQVRLRPQAPAVVFEDRTLSYAELGATSDRIAARLRSLGVGPEHRVGLFLERSVELVASMLGVLKAGGAYAPIDPTFPDRRIGWMLEDLTDPLWDAPVVLTRRELAERLGEDVRTLCLEEIGDDDEPLAESVPLPALDALAYVIFTSGSTGRPKGVAVAHRHLLSYLDSILRRLDLNAVAPDEQALQYAVVSTFSADLGNTVIFASLATGGCLHVVAQDRASDAVAMARMMREHSIDVLKIVPSHLEALLGSSSDEDARTLVPRRALVVGGEACSWELVDAVRKARPECRLVNHYGPSETTVGVTSYPLEFHTRFAPRTVPIGRPLSGARTHVLDRSMQPVPIGASGELLIGGDSVTRGYLGRPGFTAEKFVPDLYRDGERLYRTGDRVRHLPDGAIEFLGRADQQIKFHGYRLEPQEISLALNRHEQINSSLVLVQQDQHGYDVLMAYYNSRLEIDVSELRAFLAQTITEEIIPGVFVHLRRWPLTLNGKIQRSALPTLEEVRRNRERDITEPRTPHEQKLAEIWREVLGLEKISVHDNFFQLGGHSLLATQILSRLRQSFDLEIPLHLLFEQPTLEQQALAITNLQAAQEDPEDIEALLQELEGLSDEELERIAAEEGEDSGDVAPG